MSLDEVDPQWVDDFIQESREDAALLRRSSEDRPRLQRASGKVRRPKMTERSAGTSSAGTTDGPSYDSCLAQHVTLPDDCTAHHTTQLGADSWGTVFQPTTYYACMPETRTARLSFTKMSVWRFLSPCIGLHPLSRVATPPNHGHRRAAAKSLESS